MTRKRKQSPGRGRGKPSSATQSPEVRAREAEAALRAGRWRDAIQAFKALLKDDAESPDTPARKLALADAYAGRARELAQKGMLKEAAVLWDNRAALGPEIPPALEQGFLQLRLGDAAPLIEIWLQPDRLSRDDRQRAGEHLAVSALLDGEADWLEQLPSDDPVRRHAGPAQAALKAYCDGDDAALAEALSELPFRSPYRTWALLLKALARAQAEPAAAREMLARIDEASPFAPLRRAAMIALLPDAACLAELGRAGPQQLAFVAALRGWSKPQLALITKLASPGAETGDEKRLLGLLQSYRDLLGSDWVRHASLRLMAAGMDGSRLRRNPPGWTSLSRVDRALVEAWRAEQSREPWRFIDAWDDVAAALGGFGTPEPSWGRQALEIATVLRRSQAHFDLLGSDDPDNSLDSPESLAAAQLERSLLWDPEHRDTYLSLITWYRRANQLKDARRLLTQATKRWPRDIAVLDAGLETALASNAFKKAAGIAAEMLKIDPINSTARRRLVDAHIEHAAKQIPKSRGDLALKELTTARTWIERGAGLEALRHQLNLLEGLVLMVMQDVEQGRAMLTDLLAQAGPGVAPRIALVVACDQLRLKQDHVAKLLKLKVPKVQGREDLLAAIGHLRGYLERVQRFGFGLRDQLQVLLNKAPWQLLERTEIEVACEALRSFGADSLRSEAARSGLKRWPRVPMLEFHEFESRYNKKRPSNSALDKLEAAYERAKETGEHRAADRLLQLLESHQPINPFGGGPGAFPFPFPFPFGDIWDDEDEDEDDDDVPMPLPMSGAGHGYDVAKLRHVIKLIEQMPLKEALKQAGMPKALVSDLLEQSKTLGEPIVVAMLKMMLNELLAQSGGPPPRATPPRSGRRSGGAGRKKQQKQDPGDPDDPDDSPQFNLF